MGRKRRFCKKKKHLNINNFHYKQFNLQNYAVLAVLEQKMMDVCGFEPYSPLRIS